MGIRNRLFPIPVYFLKVLSKIFFIEPTIDRLVSSVEVDIEKTKTLLNWTPPVTVDNGLKKTVLSFLKGAI